MEAIVELTTGKGKFLAVMVPENSIRHNMDWYESRILRWTTEMFNKIDQVENDGLLYLYPGSYKLIGLIKDLTEEQMFQILSLDKFSVKQKLHQEERNSMYWVVVNGEHIHFDTKAKAQDFAIRMEFKSLCEANNIPEHAVLIKVIQ